MKRRDWIHSLLGAAIAGTLTFIPGCKSEDTYFAAPLEETTPVGLRGSVALPDHALGRMLFLTATSADTLETEVVPIGRNVATMAPSADGSHLYVLSRGVVPRRSDEDERPQLAVFNGSSAGGDRIVRAFDLDDPMEHLALDGEGRWVAAFGGDAKVVNPNELVLFDLQSESEDRRPQSKTIRSFGGAPEELVFTHQLHVPAGPPRRFLLVRTDRDVTLVDLLDLERPEVTIKLPENSAGATLRPLQMVYDDGDEENDADARLAIRLEGSTDVVLVNLNVPDLEGRAYSPTINIVDVGGVPSAVDFVRTDGGLRLAALVPGSAQATLIDPQTTLAEVVHLPGSFSSMRRITTVVDDVPESGDVALLWGASQNIAFWSLGSTSSTPYRSVDTAELSFVVTKVLDVPAPHAHMKVLRGDGSDIFVLDLNRRQSFPLNTSFGDARVSVAPDGERLWAFEDGSQWFSSIRLEDLHPQAIYADSRVDAVFDVETEDGGRAAIALHLGQSWDATLLDAESPDSASTHFFPALQLKGLEQ